MPGDEGLTEAQLVSQLGDAHLFVLSKTDFDKVLKSHPQFSRALNEIAQTRYKVVAGVE